MRHFGLSSRETLGGVDGLPGSRGQHYAPLPANSILAPDEPSTSEEREIVTFAAIGFGIAAFCIVGGLIYYATNFAFQP